MPDFATFPAATKALHPHFREAGFSRRKQYKHKRILPLRRGRHRELEVYLHAAGAVTSGAVGARTVLFLRGTKNYDNFCAATTNERITQRSTYTLALFFSLFFSRDTGNSARKLAPSITKEARASAHTQLRQTGPYVTASTNTQSCRCLLHMGGPPC